MTLVMNMVHLLCVTILSLIGTFSIEILTRPITWTWLCYATVVFCLILPACCDMPSSCTEPQQVMVEKIKKVSDRTAQDSWWSEMQHWQMRQIWNATRTQKEEIEYTSFKWGIPDEETLPQRIYEVINGGLWNFPDKFSSLCPHSG